MSYFLSHMSEPLYMVTWLSVVIDDTVLVNYYYVWTSYVHLLTPSLYGQAHETKQSMPSISLFSLSFKVWCLNVFVCASLVMFRWYLFFGCPRFLFPDGLQYHACFSVLVGAILRKWRKYLHFSFSIIDLIGSAFVRLCASALVINKFYLMFRSLYKHLVWTLSILLWWFPCFSETFIIISHTCNTYYFNFNLTFTYH